MPPPAVRIYKDVCFISGSNCRKNAKSDDLNGHRFCDKKSVTQKVSKTPCTAQLPFSSLSDLFRMLPCFGLCFAWFVGLLTDLFRLRVSSPLAISRLTANALLQPSLRAMTALPMTGFHRARIAPRGKQCFRNTATLGSLPQIPARIAYCPYALPANPMG